MNINQVPYLDMKAQGKRNPQSWLEMEISSIYDILSFLKLRLSYDKVDKRHDFGMVFQYKDDIVDIKSMIDAGKPKAGSLAITTPWQCMSNVKLGYVFRTGRTLAFDSFVDWNGKEVVIANVTGHILPSDISLDFIVNQHHLGTAKGGFTYLMSSNGELKSSAELEYGLSHFKLSGEHTNFPYKLNCVGDISTPNLKTKSEFNMFRGYGALDIGGKVSVDHRSILDLHWNSWFESIMEHRFNLKANINEHEFTANSNR